MTDPIQQPTPAPVLPPIQAGEPALWDIFRLFTHDPDPAVRAAAQVLVHAAHVRGFTDRPGR